MKLEIEHNEEAMKFIRKDGYRALELSNDSNWQFLPPPFFFLI